jgi:hypothetical protein
MFKRSEGGERSLRRKGIARNMLRGERGGGGSGCSDDDGDRPEPFEFPITGRIEGGDAGASRVTVCRRTTGVEEDADDDVEEVAVVVVV